MAYPNDALNIGPKPAWVMEVTPNISAPIKKHHASLSSYQLLVDEQVNVTGVNLERYSHYAYRILSPRGVANRSEISIIVDPNYETLRIHRIVIHRNSEMINALKRDSIKMLQQETELSARIYNGRYTALVVLEDVRVGDVVEYEFTVTGVNPVFKDRFVDSFQMGGRVPIHDLRYRILWPKHRNLHFKNHGLQIEPVVTTRDSVREYRWARQQSPAIPYDEEVPSWHDSIPWLQLSEYSSWKEVAVWAANLFDVNSSDTAPLNRLVSNLKKNKSRETRLLKTISFVQQEIRYMGFEMGRHSHQPHAPALVLKRRFGDCKDKSKLLVAMLTEMGHEAFPALVATRSRRSIDRYLPSPILFDHVIVALKDDNELKWIDPTDTSARGSFRTRSGYPYERALLVGDNINELTIIPPQNKRDRIQVQETYFIENYDENVELHIEKQYAGGDANAARNHFDGTPSDEIGRQLLNEFARQNPKISALGPAQLVDDQKRNVLSLKQRYTISDFWISRDHNFWSQHVATALRTPDTVIRTTPWRVIHPVRLEHTIVVHFPDDKWFFENEKDVVAAKTFRVETSAHFERRTLRLKYTYESLKDHVAAEHITEYLDARNRALDKLGYSITQDVIRESGNVVAWGTMVVLIFAVAGLVVGVPRARRWFGEGRKRSFLRAMRHAPGQSPDTPLTLKTDETPASAAACQSCGNCGKKRMTVQTQEELRYGDRGVTVVKAQCDACQDLARYYFLPISSA